MESDDPATLETHPHSITNSNEGDLSALRLDDISSPLEPQLPNNTETHHDLEEAGDMPGQEPVLGEDVADDDFGDFGNFTSTAVEMFPATDGETRYSRFSAHVANNDVKNGINVIWPVLKELESRTDHTVGLIKDTTKIVPSVNDREWVDLYHTLVSDTVFSENGGSRLAWRRSMIRQKFLQSLNISEVKKNVNVSSVSGGAKTPDDVQDKPLIKESAPKSMIKSPSNKQNTALNDREKDLVESKKLCEFSEGSLAKFKILEELRKKSVQELQSLVQSLQIYQQKMYEQSNYWLDGKEQLIMDAETHNKVIASLVQHARDQQQAPKCNFVNILTQVPKSNTSSVKRK